MSEVAVKEVDNPSCKFDNPVQIGITGYSVLKNILGGKIDIDHLTSTYIHSFDSEKFHQILETSVNTLNMVEFDETVFDIFVASQLSVEPGRLAVTSLQLSPNFSWLSGSQFSIQTTQPKLNLHSDIQTAKAQGKLTMTVNNVSENKVKLVGSRNKIWLRTPSS